MGQSLYLQRWSLYWNVGEVSYPICCVFQRGWVCVIVMGLPWNGTKVSPLTPPAEHIPEHVKTVSQRWCPKLTRFRLVLLLLSLLLVLLVLYINPSHVQNNIVLTANATTLAQPQNHEIGRESNRLRAKHTKRRLPQCLIIGTRKAGTRALLSFLDLHPQIRVAKNEVHFFDDDENYEMGMEWYRKKMPFTYPDQITMEKTPAYFSCDYVPERVYKMNSTVKLLLIVRDPIDRAMSDYLQIHENKVNKNKYDPSFEEHVIDDDGEVDHTFNPLKRSIYFRQFLRWREWFSLDQFLIISGKNLITNPLEELRKVEDFLGLEHKIRSDNFYYNASRGFYCMRNETGEKCLAPSKGRAHPDIDPLVLRKLQEFFRPFNQKFYQMIHRDMGWPWGSIQLNSLVQDCSISCMLTMKILYPCTKMLGWTPF